MKRIERFSHHPHALSARKNLTGLLPEKRISGQKADGEEDHRLMEEINKERVASQEGERDPGEHGDMGGGESPFASGIQQFPDTESHEYNAKPREQGVIIEG